MSISITQFPAGYKSAHEEVWHVVESTNKATAGFQYVFDIYKSGNLITRVKNSPYGTGKYGVLDVGNIVRATLDSADLPVMPLDNFTTPAELGADVFFTNYDVRYGEVSGGVLTTNISSGTYKVYNNYSRKPWDNKSSAILANSFLTNRPNINWYEGQPVVISVNIDSGTGDDALELTITRTGASNYVNKTYVEVQKALTFNFIPPANANEMTLFTVYDDFLGRLKFNKKCSKYDPHTLIFLNAFGAYDSMTFVHGKKLMDAERKQYEQFRWKLSSGFMKDNNIYGVYNEAKKTYATTYKEKMQLTTDILSTGEYDWLSELILSPKLYYYDVNNSAFYPVVITDSNYEFKDDRINKAETLTINIDFSVSSNSQFR
jgi:hypothetical protein